MTPETLVQVRNLSVDFRAGSAVSHAVKGVSFNIGRGETVALVGESGSGKTVSALSILRLLNYPAASHPTGEIYFAGKNLLNATEDEMREIRGRRISIIFQEPMTSLNPLHTIDKQVGEILRVHRGLDAATAQARTLELLRKVGIRDPEKRMTAYPHQLSGGQRQRVMIALALANEPDLLIADEPTTALDVTIQAQVMDLLRRLRRELGLALLFITHNLDLMAESCDRAIVLYGGRVMEEASVEPLFESPSHPYTQLLMRSIPRLSSRGTALKSIDGSPPTLGRMGAGCPFAPRCPEVTGRCRDTLPADLGVNGRRVACWARAVP